NRRLIYPIQCTNKAIGTDTKALGHSPARSRHTRRCTLETQRKQRSCKQKLGNRRHDMTATISIYDETTAGERSPACSLDFITETITIRELIRERVYQEVREFNARTPEYFKGLVQPSEAEKTLNGFKLRTSRKIDWEKQFKLAIEAFERNGFFILVDDRQL